MDRFATLSGRRYAPYEYVGDPAAERVVVLMGSGCETAEETVAVLREAGERVGLLKVRLFRPFAAERFVAAKSSQWQMIRDVVAGLKAKGLLK